MDKRAREKKKTELSSPTEKIRSEEKKAIRKKIGKGFGESIDVVIRERDS